MASVATIVPSSLASTENMDDNNTSSSSSSLWKTNENMIKSSTTITTSNVIAKRICVVGNVDAGKSTLVACLSKHILDDGRGLARSRVLRHRHEQEGGKSSSVAQEIVGYDKEDKHVIPPEHLTGSKVWAEVASKSDTTLTLVDLCGHEKYLKTTVFGLVGYSPDAAMLVVGSNAGFQKMAREHLQLMLALRVPFFVVFTKCDSMTPRHVALNTLDQVERVLRNVSKKPYRMRNAKQIDQAITGLNSGKITPLFSVSCVTGDGIDLLRTFLCKLSQSSVKFQQIPQDNTASSAASDASANQLLQVEQKDNQDEEALINKINHVTLDDEKTRKKQDHQMTEEEEDYVRQEAIFANAIQELHSNTKSFATKTDLIEFVIDSNFLVPGVGVVAGGRMISGTIRTGDRVLLGPDKVGAFRPVIIRSIHVACRPVDEVSEGMPATFALRSAPAAGREKSLAKSFPFTTINANRDPLIRDQVRKGMVLLAGEELHRNVVTREFEATVHCLHSATMITCGYSPVVNVGTVCRTARIVAIDGVSGKRSVRSNGGASGGEVGPILRTGMKARLRFQFEHPQRVSPGQVIVFREGTCRGCGRIVEAAPCNL